MWAPRPNLGKVPAILPPLPPIVHRVLRRHEAPPGTRVLIVGDIHGGLGNSEHYSLSMTITHTRTIVLHTGCLDELRSLLDRCEFRPAEDVLVSVGDLVNKVLRM